MHTVMEEVMEFLDKHAIRFDLTETRTMLRLGFAGEHGRFDGVVIANEETRLLLYLNMFPIRVPPQQRPAFAELVNQINWNISLGNIEMNKEGEVRMRTSIGLGPTSPDEETIGHLIMANVSVMDHYFTALASVAMGSESATSALNRLAKQDDESTGKGPSASPRRFGGRLGGLMDGSDN